VIAILGGVWRPTQVGSDQPDWIRRAAELDPVLAGAYATDVTVRMLRDQAAINSLGARTSSGNHDVPFRRPNQRDDA